MYKINEDGEIYINRWYGAIFIPQEKIDMPEFNTDIAHFTIINMVSILIITLLGGIVIQALFLSGNFLKAFGVSFCLSIGISLFVFHQIMVMFICKKYNCKTRPMTWKDVK